MSNNGLAEINPDMDFEKVNQHLRAHISREENGELASMGVAAAIEEIASKVGRLSERQIGGFRMHTKTNRHEAAVMAVITLPKGIVFDAESDALLADFG